MRTRRSKSDTRPANPGRLFSERELIELATPPLAALRNKLKKVNPGAALALVFDLEQAWRAYYLRLGQRVRATTGFYQRRYGATAKARMVAGLQDFTTIYRTVDVVTVDQPGLGAQVSHDIRQGDSPSALAHYATMERQWRHLIDYRRDRYSALLSYVYRTHGIDELEAIHRFAGRRALANLIAEAERPARIRMIEFAQFLRTIFSTIRIAEYDDRFAITQQVCGTCGRQVLGGRYEPPLSLAVVREKHLVTWHRGNTPIYRTHVPVWHVAMARERIGVAWPVNRCPVGLTAGPCEILLFKDPRDAAANEAVPA